jgi:AraC-like DNA-binding protein
MKPFLDLWSVVILLGAAQGVFLSGVFFFSPQGARLSNRLLGLLTLSLALPVIEILLCYSGYIQFVPFFVGLTEPLNFVFPPLLYLYTRSLVQPGFRWRGRYLGLLLPALAHAIYQLPFFAQSAAWKLQTVAESFHQPLPPAPIAEHSFWWLATYDAFYSVFFLILGSYFLLYMLLELRLIYQYWQRNPSPLSSPQVTMRGWLSRLGLAFGLLLILYIGATAYYQNDEGDVLVATVLALLFYSLSGRAIRHSGLLATLPAAEPDEPLPVRKKYEKTALSPEAAGKVLERLRTWMASTDAYRNGDLTLPVVAAELSVPLHHLSQVINEHCQQNFFDFINSYRVEEVKRQLLMPESAYLKLEEIGFAAGFNSKSAFNAAFKKSTQLTPSQFRKNALVA